MGEWMLVCSFEIIMLVNFSKLLLKRRRFNKKIINYTILILTICCHLIINNYYNLCMNLFGILVIYCIYTIISYLESPLKCISTAICFYILVIVPEFIILIIFSLDTYKEAENVLRDDLGELCLMLVAKTITFIIVKFLEQIHKIDKHTKVRNSIFSVFLVLPIAIIIWLIGLFLADINIPSKNRIFLKTSIYILFFANISMFYLFDKLIEMIENAKKIEQLYVKSQIENKYYNQMELIYREYGILLHDIKKYIRIAVSLIKTKEFIKAERIFEELDIKIGNIYQANYCANKVLNAILCERKMKADEMNINFIVNLTDDLYVEYINEMDMISITSNLIDNAIEAAGKLSENAFVKIDMFMRNEGYFMIWKVSNNFLFPPVKGKKGFVTNKFNKEKHGIGIHIIKKIVKSYNGKLEINVEGKEFTVSIIFQIDKENL